MISSRAILKTRRPDEIIFPRPDSDWINLTFVVPPCCTGYTNTGRFITAFSGDKWIFRNFKCLYISDGDKLTDPWNGIRQSSSHQLVGPNENSYTGFDGIHFFLQGGQGVQRSTDATALLWEGVNRRSKASVSFAISGTHSALIGPSNILLTYTNPNITAYSTTTLATDASRICFYDNKWLYISHHRNSVRVKIGQDPSGATGWVAPALNNHPNYVQLHDAVYNGYFWIMSGSAFNGTNERRPGSGVYTSIDPTVSFDFIEPDAIGPSVTLRNIHFNDKYTFITGAICNGGISYTSYIFYAENSRVNDEYAWNSVELMTTNTYWFDNIYSTNRYIILMNSAGNIRYIDRGF